MNKTNLNQKVRESCILIAAHEDVKGGVAHVLRDYLLQKKPNKLLFIAHPLLYFKENYKKSSYFEFYTNGRLGKKQVAFHWQLPEQLLYLKDFVYILLWALKTNTKYDLVVALDPLNAVAALVLRMLGRTKKVVHYSIDYFPTRFENPVMNWLYHRIDKIAVRFSNETWNLGGRMARARAWGNNMRGGEYKKRQKHVPVGVWFAKIKRHRINKFDRNKLVFAGGFVPYMGIDMALRALPKIIKKIPKLEFEIIGRGEEEQNWHRIAEGLGIEKHITYTDWIQDRQKFHLRLSGAALGLAPFNLHILDDKVKNADPGKIKDYTSVGLPVITTKAIYTWRDIEKAKCGIVINYNTNEFANAVIKLLKNRKLLLQYRKNAIEYAKQFDWDKLFTENLSRIMAK